MTALNAKIKIEIINDYAKYEDWGTKDLADQNTYSFFVLAFGNAIIDEARIVAETKAGILIFANLLERGGYRRGKATDIKHATMYQDGDTCYPEHFPFIFISPRAENGDVVDLDNYEAEVESLKDLL